MSAAERCERAIALLADELNQLGLAIERHAVDHPEKDHELFHAARRLREKIAGLIPT